jgi:hypothetical protein
MTCPTAIDDIHQFVTFWSMVHSLKLSNCLIFVWLSFTLVMQEETIWLSAKWSLPESKAWDGKPVSD